MIQAESSTVETPVLSYDRRRGLSGVEQMEANDHNNRATSVSAKEEAV